MTENDKDLLDLNSIIKNWTQQIEYAADALNLFLERLKKDDDTIVCAEIRQQKIKEIMDEYYG